MWYIKTLKRITIMLHIFFLINIGFIGLLIYSGVIENCVVESAVVIVDNNGQGNYTSIQEAINNSNPGDKIYVWSGLYNERILIDKSITLIGNITDRPIINTTGKRPPYIQLSADRINITGFNIIGEIKLEDIENCKINNNYCNSIDLSSSNNNTILNNICEDINLFESKNNVIESNSIGNDGSLYLSSSNLNKIYNNIYKNNTGIVLWSSSLNIINENIFMKDSYGVKIDHSFSNTIINNDFTTRESSIYLIYSKNIKIKNNTMRFFGITIKGNSKEHFNTHDIGESNFINNKPIYYWKNRTGGNIPANAGEIILVNCTNIKVSKQNLSNGTYGIILAFTNNSLIFDNICDSNHFGIDLHYSHNNTLNNNTFLNNIRGSIITYSDHNSFQNNLCSNNKINGLYLVYSNSNIIINNSIFNNGVGIYIGGETKNNQIYSNNLINNTSQACDDGTNKWDNGYPFGGNYWSDFKGKDIKNGPNQNKNDSDGIGDTPYYIKCNSNRDNYPLMKPLSFEKIQNNDTDNDNLPNEWEIKFGLNPFDSSDFDEDNDNDGYSNKKEFDNGWDPINPNDPILEYPKKEKENNQKIDYAFILGLVVFIVIFLEIFYLMMYVKKKKK